MASGSRANTPDPDALSMWSVSDLFPFEKWWAYTNEQSSRSENFSMRLTISPIAPASFSSAPVANL